MARRLNPVREKLKHPDEAAQFQKALSDLALGQGGDFLAGVKAYQQHPETRTAPDAPVIWQSGTTCLRDYRPEGGTPVLVIPSLINRFDILDLMPEHSLLRFMAERGLRPLLVDWGTPEEEEAAFTVGDYVLRRLAPILDFVTFTAGPCAILGYCMGGLLAVALAVLRPEQTRSLALMATPWDFPAAEGFAELLDKLEPTLAHVGALPVDILQALFASFQPFHALQKFSRFAALDPASVEARRFVLTEDWLNDGVPLTAPVARECLRDWYGANVTGRLIWRVGGQAIDPRRWHGPAYVIVPNQDRIVTPESALPLARLMRGAVLHQPTMGHIALLASGKAPQQVWEPLVKWLG